MPGFSPPFRLSRLAIDSHKDWNGFRIQNLGPPTAGGHALRRGDESLIDHDTLLNFIIAEHLSLPATIANVLTNHNLTNHPLSIIPTMDDAHIPDLETLSYGGAFATAQIPSLDASKITTGILAVARIPNLDASKVISGVFNQLRIPWTTIPASGIVIGGDVNLYRVSPNILKTDGYFYVGGSLDVLAGNLALNLMKGIGVGNVMLRTAVSGDADARFLIKANGEIMWGTGTGAFDVNLYRAGENWLKTDDLLQVVIGIKIDALAGGGDRDVRVGNDGILYAT